MVVANIKGVASLLEKMKGQMSRALPKHMTPDRMARVAITSVQRTPKLLQCTEKSLAGAIMQASQLGLEPDGVLGHAYLIPYGKQCNFLIGYKGLIALARRSGEIQSIHAVAVYKDDLFHYERGLDEKLVHKPSREPSNHAAKDVVAAYAVARLKDGAVQWEVMERWAVDTIRDRSQAGKSGPWVTDYAEMAKKTVLRRLCKTLPLSVETERGIAAEELGERGIAVDEDLVQADMVVVDDEPAPSGLAAHAQKIMADATPPPKPPSEPSARSKAAKAREAKKKSKAPSGQQSLVPDDPVTVPPSEEEVEIVITDEPTKEELVSALGMMAENEGYASVLMHWKVDPDDMADSEYKNLYWAHRTLCEKAEAAKT
jgi:recombination protein RecT